MIVDDEGWCSPEPGQSRSDFIKEFRASRPPLTPAEIVKLRAIFRPAIERETRQAEAA